MVIKIKGDAAERASEMLANGASAHDVAEALGVRAMTRRRDPSTTRLHHLRVPVTPQEKLILLALCDGAPMAECIRELISREAERRGIR